MNTTRKNITLSLKVLIIYFVLYGLLTEYFVITYWEEWQSRVEGKSIGYTLGYFTKGPILGIFYIIAAGGLCYRKLWASKLAVVTLLFAVFSEVQAVAWGYAQAAEIAAPTSIIYLLSTIAVVLWNGIWLYLLYRNRGAYS